MLVQSIVGISILLTLMMGFAQVSTNAARESKNAKIKLSLLSTRNKIMTVLMNDDSWGKTFNHPRNSGAFRCAKDPSLTCSSSDRALFFQLFDAYGRPVSEDPLGAPGFNYSEQACTGFNGNLGNGDCPVGVTLGWNRVCENPCINPSLRVTVNFQFKDPFNDFPYNPHHLNSEIVRSSRSSTTNIVLHEEWNSSDPGFLRTYTPSMKMRRAEMERTITLKKERLLVINGNAAMNLQPGGGAGSDSIKHKNHAVNLLIDGVEVGGSKSTSIVAAPVETEDMAYRVGSVSWAQKVGPGDVKIEFTQAGWNVPRGGYPVAPPPEVIFTNLSFTVYK